MSGAGNMFTQRAPDAQAVLVANVEVVAEGDGGAELLGVAPRRLLVLVVGRRIGPVGDVFRLGVWRRLALATAAVVGVSAGETLQKCVIKCGFTYSRFHSCKIVLSFRNIFFVFFFVYTLRYFLCLSGRKYIFFFVSFLSKFLVSSSLS